MFIVQQIAYKSGVIFMIISFFSRAAQFEYDNKHVALQTYADTLNLNVLTATSVRLCRLKLVWTFQKYYSKYIFALWKIALESNLRTSFSFNRNENKNNPNFYLCECGIIANGKLYDPFHSWP